MAAEKRALSLSLYVFGPTGQGWDDSLTLFLAREYARLPICEQRLTRGPYRSITPSPNGRFLAILTVPPSPPSNSTTSTATDPLLWVTSSDFARSLSEFSITPDVSEGERGRGGGGPGAVEWCGSNSVVLGWERTVVMVGPFGETLK